MRSMEGSRKVGGRGRGTTRRNGGGRGDHGRVTMAGQGEGAGPVRYTPYVVAPVGG